MLADSIVVVGIQSGLDAVVAWLLTYAVHSTVLIAAAWIAAVCLARAACGSARLRDALPSIRERLWKLALVGGLATAGAQAMFGFDPWGLQLALRTNMTAEVASTSIERAPTMMTPAVTPPGEPLASSSTQPATAPVAGPAASNAKIPARTHAADAAGQSPAIVPAALVHSAEPQPVAATVADPLSAAAADARMPGWIQIVVLLWLAGVLFGLARWACQWNGLLRSLDDREPIVSGNVYEIFQHLRVRSKRRTNVALYAAPGIHAPITLGMRRFAICLPPRVATELQHDEIGALLAHELAHAERRDPVWVVACRAIEIVFFFQPLNKLCAGWLADEAEYLCDDRAVVQIGERVPLASCLTEIAGWIVHGTPSSRLAPGMAAPGTRLSLRVGRLLDEDHDPNAPDTSRWFTAAVVPAALCVAVFVPGVAAQAPVALVEEEVAYEHDQDREDEDLRDRASELELVLQEELDELPEPAAPPEPAELATSPDPLAPADPVVATAPELVTLVWVTSPVQFLATVPAPPTEAEEGTDALDSIAALDALADEIERLRAELATRDGNESLARRLDTLTSRMNVLRERAGALQSLLDAIEDAAPLADEPSVPAELSSPNTSVPSFPLQSKD